MPSAENTEKLSAIKDDIDGVSAMWVCDYRGLSVKEIQQLRRNIRDAGAYMKVHKNTLVRLALSELGQPNMDDILAGPSAFVFSGDDPVTSAKVLKDFAKENEALEIKGGLMDNAYLSAAEVEAVAALPSREQLYGQLAGLISGFARNLASVLNEVPGSVARSISAVREGKQAA